MSLDRSEETIRRDGGAFREFDNIAENISHQPWFSKIVRVPTDWHSADSLPQN